MEPISEQLLTGGVSANVDIMDETLAFEVDMVVVFVELDAESELELLVSLDGLSGLGQWEASFSRILTRFSKLAILI